jgi:hypothetical protein
VHECSYDENKTRSQDARNLYSFVGKVDLPEITPDLSGAVRKRRMGTAKILTSLLLLYRTQAKSQGMKQLMAGAASPSSASPWCRS